MEHADRARGLLAGGRAARGLAALALVLVLAPAAARAQSATLAMTSDRAQVAVGDHFRVQVRLDVTGAEAPEPQLPDMSDFDVLSRQVSRPMQFRFGFGSQTQVVQSTAVYTFLLRARQPGRYELPPARATIAGREFVSNPLTVVVGGGAPGGVPPQQQGAVPPQQQGAAPPPASQPPSGPLDGAIYDDQAFLRTVVDRSDPWLGQQVTVTIYLYVRGALRGSPVITREPTTDGLWVHDLLPPSRTLEPTTQVVGSTPFRVYVLRRFAAFPLRAGDLTIGATSVQIPVGNVFDIFAGASPDLARTGVDLTLSVRDLPAAGRPQGDVHVGQITLESSLDRNQVPTGDAVTLTVQATGTGYVQGIRLDDPRVDGLRVLAPQTDDQISAPGDLVGGTRTFEWLIVPEREGTHSIPAFRVATFDPTSGRYGVAESAPIGLTAAGNPVATAVEPDEALGEPTQDGAPGEAQLGPLRTESALSRTSEGLAERAWYPWLLALFPLAWLGIVIATAARRRAAARAGVSTPQTIAREARRRLVVAEELATRGEAREFYAAISLALRSVVEGRLGEAVGSLTHKQLERRLVERGMSGELARRIAEELEGHEMVRFSASGAQPGEMQATLGRARELIGELDRFTAKPAEEA
ncbi:MAG: BatD family protein [Myxococcota bacterium]|nr:BatD family protein [Myxococcota bacterium]